MKEWCLAHPVMTFFLAWFAIEAIKHVGHHIAHIFIKHPMYGHEQPPEA